MFDSTTTFPPPHTTLVLPLPFLSPYTDNHTYKTTNDCCFCHGFLTIHCMLRAACCVLLHFTTRTTNQRWMAYSQPEVEAKVVEIVAGFDREQCYYLETLRQWLCA